MAFRIQIDVDDATEARVVEAFTAAYGYRAQVPDPAFTPTDANPGPAPMVPNPTTPQQFVREQVRRYVRDVIAGHEVARATETARKTARTKADGVLA